MLTKWFIPLALGIFVAQVAYTHWRTDTSGRAQSQLNEPHESSLSHTDAATVSAVETTVKFQVPGESMAFLGPRPSVRAYANHTKIVEACTGSGPRGWQNTRGCAEYLRDQEKDYLIVDNESSDTVCEQNKPYLYHTYWRGPFTWRVSYMLKSFLYTQNLKCSVMHIWLDADSDEDIVDKNLNSPFFKPFRPLIKSGLITLRSWRYPASVVIPPEFQSTGLGSSNSLVFPPHLIPRGAVAVSDSVRFIVLHYEGGFYIDMDTIFLRDLRPLLIAPGLSFAERWGAHPGRGEYNTAYLRMEPNSSISSRILQEAVSMGVNFHPRVLGRMLAKTGFDPDLVRFETGLFDPLWSEFDNERIGLCCTPCLKKFEEFFMPFPLRGEWDTLDIERDRIIVGDLDRVGGNLLWPTTTLAVNRTLASFYRGSYTHHMHNQWSTKIRPGSWAWVADQTYHQFLRGDRPNPYGEQWTLAPMDFSYEESMYKHRHT